MCNSLNSLSLNVIYSILARGIFCESNITDAKRPNIIFILADDMGYNDVGYHNPKVISPNIDDLARSGIRLEQNYVQPQCTPSRAALMTGMYPYHIGRQNGIIKPTDPTGLTLNRTLIPELLKRNGYRTHLVGKWHLGHCNKAYLPLSRGFDTHYGYWEGGEDYYKKTRQKKIDFKDGYSNLHQSQHPKVYTTYSTYLYTKRILNILKLHSTHHRENPLFMLFAAQSIHSPHQVPDIYQNMYRNSTRQSLGLTKKIRAMVTALDDVVGNITRCLKDQKMYKNTIIIFSSDNGGIKQNKEGNWPLKGAKGQVFEGGTRVPGFIHASLLPRKGYISTDLIHITDWFPTLLRIAGVAKDQVNALAPSMDGIDQHSVFFAQNKEQAVRTEMVYNLQNVNRKNQITGAIRRGYWKLVKTKHKMVLYNLKDDPREQKNLAASRQDIVSQLNMLIIKMADSMVHDNKKFSRINNRDVDLNGYVRTGWCKT